MPKQTVAACISSLIEARAYCEKRAATTNDSHAKEWFDRHSERLAALERCYLPSGAGIDSGTKIDLLRSEPDKLVFHTSFHHMKDVGYYDGWTEHTITVRPGFNGLQIAISGRDPNGIKEWLHQTFEEVLSEMIDDGDLPQV